VIQPDVALSAVQGDFDALLLPGGGEGARRLCAAGAVGDWLRRYEQQGRWVGAICAAPSALAAHGVFAGKQMTIFPGLEDKIATHGRHRAARVVSDGKLVTSQGPGTAFEFALTLAANLQGAETAAQVELSLVLPQVFVR
jgi:protein DJ-1